ncbi:MAG: VOC family protein [Chloroflexi bacterium]|nr:VOC family protein [Chloroflexota bacterium]
MARATGLFHATLPVWDLERAERFWRELLGVQRHATPSYHPAAVVFLDLGNAMLHLVRYPDDVPRPDPRSTHVAIEVDDVDDAAAVVRSRGLPVLGGPLARPDGSRSFYFLDPDNNRIELIQRFGSGG